MSDAPPTPPARPERPSYLQRLRTIRDQPGALESLLLAVGCILFVLGLWHFLSGGFGNKRIVNAFILPTIAETFGSFGTLWNERAKNWRQVARQQQTGAGYRRRPAMWRSSA